MDPRFAVHNAHREAPSRFAELDPHLRRLRGLPLVHENALLDRLPRDEPGIYTLGGARQVGKTTLVKQWMARLLARGVPPEHLTMSSDANGNMIQRDAAGRVTGVVTQSMRWLFDEFRDLVRAHGVPLQTALLPFTTNPARCFALQGKGRLAVGADADLLLLDDDLEPRAVIARGSVLREDGRAIVKGVFE